VPGLERLAVTAAAGQHINGQGTAWSVRLDVLWCRLSPQPPGDVTAVADLVKRCSKRDLELPLELPADLPLEGLLIALDSQEEDCPLLLVLPKNAC
jgi:hypothetical protein